jgi:hypothetical protein
MAPNYIDSRDYGDILNRKASVPTRKREKLDVPVVGRLALSKYRTLEAWCTRSLRRRAEVVGIMLERVLEIYEQEADADEPIEHFVRRLHLGKES